MSKGFGEKLLGLFIEEDVDSTRAPEARQAKVAEPPPAVMRDVSAAAASPPVPPPLPGAAPDARSFAAVYRSVGLPDADRERLMKVIGLLESLPREASPEVNRAIVGASLEAFGVPIEGVVRTGNGALAALDAHVIEGQRRTEEVLGQAEARIAKLNAEIEEVRRLMAVQAVAQEELVRRAAAERARVRVVLDFFEGARGGGSHVAPDGASLGGTQATPRLRRIS